MLNEISIEIIRKCPNNCLHCSSYSSINCTEMISFDKFTEVINGGIKLGLNTVCFSGGEPFLHPQIIEMIKYVFKRGLSSYVYTSGICLSSKQQRISIPENILSEICGKVTKLIFNIEGASPSTYDVIMGTKGNFELLNKSITSARKFNIVTEAHFVPMKLNIHEIESTIDFCKELGVSKISFLRLVLHGRAFENAHKIALSDKETENLKEKLNFISKNDSVDIRIGVPLSEENNKDSCEAARGKLNIKYDGFVYPCEVFKNNRIKMKDLVPENINEIDIESIYKNSMYLKYVRNYIAEFGKVKNCENCVGQYLIKSFSKDGDNNG
ncbi:radical SAM protein [Clostridium sp. P21]|uniref:Radical SAM protein n=1 Tax=Clostridium muellerianum TaxID=2716538 RepID=A0A7Y0EGL3_9CLOT|nr:radical SAM protein [Clostridium muellerianum]NMM62080.1 radical SAM protein [Clostridium muellerianum]